MKAMIIALAVIMLTACHRTETETETETANDWSDLEVDVDTSMDDVRSSLDDLDDELLNLESVAIELTDVINLTDVYNMGNGMVAIDEESYARIVELANDIRSASDGALTELRNIDI